MANLGLLLDKHIIEDFDKTLHSFLERQFAISPEQLKVKVTLGHLLKWIKTVLLVILFVFWLTESDLEGHLDVLLSVPFLTLGSLLFSVNDIFLIKLHQDFLGELAPKLREEVARGKQLFVHLGVNVGLVVLESGNGQHIVEDYGDLQTKT